MRLRLETLSSEAQLSILAASGLVVTASQSVRGIHRPSVGRSDRDRKTQDVTMPCKRWGFVTCDRPKAPRPVSITQREIPRSESCVAE